MTTHAAAYTQSGRDTGHALCGDPNGPVPQPGRSFVRVLIIAPSADTGAGLGCCTSPL